MIVSVLFASGFVESFMLTSSSAHSYCAYVCFRSTKTIVEIFFVVVKVVLIFDFTVLVFVEKHSMHSKDIKISRNIASFVSVTTLMRYPIWKASDMSINFDLIHAVTIA